jgi:probable HAF family extracellular repeat protein
MTDLGTLVGAVSWAYDVNDNGQVVGWAYTTSNAEHAFLYSGSMMIDLNTLIDLLSGWALQEAYDINDAGQIVGYGSIGNQTHAFLLTPVPQAVHAHSARYQHRWPAGLHLATDWCVMSIAVMSDKKRLNG